MYYTIRIYVYRPDKIEDKLFLIALVPYDMTWYLTYDHFFPLVNDFGYIN